MLLEMGRFGSFDGTQLAYDVQGAGPLVLLLHGFASDSFINWVRPGIVDALTSAGYRTATLDQRGHGESDKPHDPAAYADDALVRDARALLDHLEADECFVVGYSMGAWVTLGLLRAEGRARAAVLGGVGARMLERLTRDHDPIVEALETDDPATITDRVARSFRDFADLTNADRHALAALRRAQAYRPADGLEDVAVPILVLSGDDDPLAGSPQELAERIPGARAAVVGGSHLNVINNAAFRREIVGFLDEHR